MQHAGGVENGVYHQWRRRVAGADLVLQDSLRHRAPQLRREQRRRVLVQRAELILAAVGPGEAERPRLLPAAALRGPQPAGESAEVEPLDADGCRPQLAIVRSEQELVQSAGPVAGPGHDDRVGRLRVRAPGQQPATGERDADSAQQAHRVHAASRAGVSCAAAIACDWAVAGSPTARFLAWR